jgi:hypothetical protein
MSRFAFAALDAYGQRHVVSELLHEYGKWDFAKRSTQIQSIEYNGGRYAMDYKTVSKLAADFMMEDHFKARRLELLVTEMKKRRITNIYEHLMGESIERALK